MKSQYLIEFNILKNIIFYRFLLLCCCCKKKERKENNKGRIEEMVVVEAFPSGWRIQCDSGHDGWPITC